MSDTTTTTTDPGAGAPAPSAPTTAVPPAAAAPAAPPAAVTAPVGGADSVLDGDLPDQPLFDQGYVRDIRNRATQYRTQVRELESKVGAYSVFDQYEPDDRQVWIDLAAMYAADPAAAAQAMQEIAAAVLTDGAKAPDGNGAAVPPPAPAIDGTAAALTPEAVQKMVEDGIAGYKKSQEEAAAIETVYGEVRAGGYDPDTMDGFMVLWIANHETDGDISKAIATLKARDQAVIDNFVQGRTGTPQAGVAPSNGAVATSTPTPPVSWDDTRKAAQAFLNGQGQPGQA